MVEGLEGRDEGVLGEVANPDYPDAERRFWHPHRGVWWGFKSEWLLHGVCMWLRPFSRDFPRERMPVWSRLWYFNKI